MKQENTDDSYTRQDVQLARMMKALGHPARVAILRFLSKNESCFCGDIVEHLPLAQATVSQHLKELKSAGLIQGEINGPRTCYCLHPAALKELSKLMTSLITKIQEKSCC